MNVKYSSLDYFQDETLIWKTQKPCYSSPCSRDAKSVQVSEWGARCDSLFLFLTASRGGDELEGAFTQVLFLSTI